MEREFTIKEIASLFDLSEDTVRDVIERRRCSARRDFFTISQLAERWGCSRVTVYNVWRSTGTRVVNFAARGHRGRKIVPAAAVEEIEGKKLRRLSQSSD